MRPRVLTASYHLPAYWTFRNRHHLPIYFIEYLIFHVVQQKIPTKIDVLRQTSMSAFVLADCLILMRRAMIWGIRFPKSSYLKGTDKWISFSESLEFHVRCSSKVGNSAFLGPKNLKTYNSLFFKSFIFGFIFLYARNPISITKTSRKKNGLRYNMNM